MRRVVTKQSLTALTGERKATTTLSSTDQQKHILRRKAVEHRGTESKGRGRKPEREGWLLCPLEKLTNLDLSQSLLSPSRVSSSVCLSVSHDLSGASTGRRSSSEGQSPRGLTQKCSRALAEQLLLRRQARLRCRKTRRRHFGSLTEVYFSFP